MVLGSGLPQMASALPPQPVSHCHLGGVVLLSHFSSAGSKHGPRKGSSTRRAMPHPTQLTTKKKELSKLFDECNTLQVRCTASANKQQCHQDGVPRGTNGFRCSARRGTGNPLGAVRHKVAVYDYIWTEDPSAGCATSSCDPQRGAGPSGAAPGRGETSTRVSVYTLHLSGLREQHRHFLRQPDGAIVEVTGNVTGAEPPQSVIACPRKGQEKDAGTCSSHQLRERKKKKAAWRSHRVEPAGRSRSESGAAPKHLSL
ncbi:hypothetical protein SKAU_G00054990 [Synaphobranchus kaupii]|uniref:Uncharacterized protein n=1 Tax=Synaphobranchus kaupii TaxID=118154 RepID=A0A9Q1G4T4_SYNKA|nr:hypothetical protein SKAU_G00054990 [Synaphobranchus kaupii]